MGPAWSSSAVAGVGAAVMVTAGIDSGCLGLGPVIVTAGVLISQCYRVPGVCSVTDGVGLLGTGGANTRGGGTFACLHTRLWLFWLW